MVGCAERGAARISWVEDLQGGAPINTLPINSRMEGAAAAEEEEVGGGAPAMVTTRSKLRKREREDAPIAARTRK